MDPLLALTCAALSGLASRESARHGIEPRTAEAVGAEAVALAKGALAAYEADATKPTAKRKG